MQGGLCGLRLGTGVSTLDLPSFRPLISQRAARGNISEGKEGKERAGADNDRIIDRKSVV